MMKFSKGIENGTKCCHKLFFFAAYAGTCHISNVRKISLSSRLCLILCFRLEHFGNYCFEKLKHEYEGHETITNTIQARCTPRAMSLIREFAEANPQSRATRYLKYREAQAF